MNVAGPTVAASTPALPTAFDRVPANTVTAAGHLSLLLVEDDPEIAAHVTEGLRTLGVAASSVGDGASALRHRGEVDVIVLDVGLPDMDGFEVCRQLRMSSQVPIIFLSGRADEFDRVLALKMGADDYLVKPCGMRELAARVEAVVRRARSAGQAVHDGPPEPVLRVGAVTIDCAAREVTVDAEVVRLSRKEFDLLALLAAEPGKVLTRDAIMLEVWGYESFGDTRTLGVHIAGLRKKLGDPTLIETVRGIGFRIRT